MYVKVLQKTLLGNSYSFEALKFLTSSDSAPLFMAQLKWEKADLTKETAGFSYQKLDIYRKTESRSFASLEYKYSISKSKI